MSREPIKIRRALVRDAAQVHAVMLAAKDDIPLRCPFEREEYKTTVRHYCRSGAAWVAEIGGKLAGVVVLDGTELFYLVTEAAFRRKGVGRALVRRAEKITKRRHGSGMTAEVWENNQPIAKLLLNEGFRLDPDNQAPERHELLNLVKPKFVTYTLGTVPLELRQI